MNLLNDPEEFPVAPPIPEIKPDRTNPQPIVHPEPPTIIRPVEDPGKNNPPEIIPEKTKEDFGIKS